MFNRNIHYKWPFSIAMLNYQRVLPGPAVIASNDQHHAMICNAPGRVGGANPTCCDQFNQRDQRDQFDLVRL